MGTNMGLWKMAEVSGLGHPSMLTTARNYLRLETLHAANDAITHAIAGLPAFHLYDIQNALHQQLRQRRHAPTAETGQWLGSIVQGYFNDHAMPGHMRTLGTFRRRVIRLWRRQLRLRSQKTRLNWRRFGVLLRRWIPTQRILHPFPSVRFDAMHPR